MKSASARWIVPVGIFGPATFGGFDRKWEWPGHTEGLDPAIKILVIDRVFIMVESGDRARHLVGKKGTAIDSRLGLDRIRMVAPGQALMAGVIRTVDPIGEKLKLVVPATLNWR